MACGFDSHRAYHLNLVIKRVLYGVQDVQNTLWTGDNLYILNGINSNLVDLIYLDPPFNSKRFYSAPIGSKAAGSSFKDMWTWDDIDEGYLDTIGSKKEYLPLAEFILSVGELHSEPMKAYLTYMTQRLIQMHRVLKDTGSLYLHCDPTASHYLKIILDAIFGKNNFRNEIIWQRDVAGKGGKRVSNQFPRNHDTLLFYSKSSDLIYRQQYTDLSEGQKRPYRYSEEATSRKYKAVQLGHYSDKSISEMESNDLIHVSGSGKKYKKYYLDEAKATVGNIWTDILGFGTRTSSKERTGYPTQKPLDLLYRIVEASTNEGDVVMDPFCGCATTCVAAQHLGRKWIGIDVAALAAELVAERLSDAAGLFKDFVRRSDVPQRDDVKEEKISKPSVKERLYEVQGGNCNGCGTSMEMRNFDVDHIIPQSKGGGNYYENYQLLCGHCNRTKGDRPMAYLMDKIRKRQEMIMENAYGIA